MRKQLRGINFLRQRGQIFQTVGSYPPLSLFVMLLLVPFAFSALLMPFLAQLFV
jgi:hypothetical protein